MIFVTFDSKQFQNSYINQWNYKYLTVIKLNVTFEKLVFGYNKIY